MNTGNQCFYNLITFVAYLENMGTKNIINKKIKSRSINFKVSNKQKQLIDAYCKKKSLGTVQLFKLAIREYIERNAIQEQNFTYCPNNENQLTIFDVISELEQDD